MKSAIKKACLISILSVVCNQASSESYTYDELGRLVTVERDGKTTSYTYDDANNRKIKQVSSSSSSQPPANNSPSCENESVYMGGVPPQAGPVSMTLSESAVLNLCSDPDGDTLTVTSPSVPHSFTVSAGQSTNINFTVSDGNGGTASGTFTFTRPG